MEDQQGIFLRLLEEHRGILLKVSRIYMDNPVDREDLEQEIIYQLWKSYANFKGKSSFSTWMYRVALNTAITYFKKDKKRLDHSVEQLETNFSSESTNEEEEGKLAHFYKAVHKLNKVEKAIILLFIEGRSHKEIASNLGISEGNARVKLNRTKTKIQTLIKAQGYEF